MSTRAARGAPRRAWFAAPVLLVGFTLLVNLVAFGDRSSATEELQLVGPAAITLTTAAVQSGPTSSTSPLPAQAQREEVAPAGATARPSRAAPPLGRTEMLDITAQPSGSVMAYTPADTDVGTTVPIALLAGGRLWQDLSDGMAPVALPGGDTLGYAYPHDGEQVRPLAVSAVGTSVVSNLDAGGSTWEWTDSTGTQFLNHYDLGREVQASFFVRTKDGRKLNPTEAGDRFADPRVPPLLRHSSPLVNASVDGTRQSTRSVPLEWSPPRVDPRAGNGHPVIYPDVRLGKDLELAYGGRANVARYDTILTLPSPTTNGELEAPTAYLRNSFNRLFTFDARTRQLTPIAPRPFDKKGLDWTPPSGWGALIASDATGTHAFALYAATVRVGGTITEFTAHDFHLLTGANGAGDVGTLKLRALRIGDFPAGTTSTTTYIVTGSLASVQDDIASLATQAVM